MTNNSIDEKLLIQVTDSALTFLDMHKRFGRDVPLYWEDCVRKWPAEFRFVVDNSRQFFYGMPSGYGKKEERDAIELISRIDMILCELEQVVHDLGCLITKEFLLFLETAIAAVQSDGNLMIPTCHECLWHEAPDLLDTAVEYRNWCEGDKHIVPVGRDPIMCDLYSIRFLVEYVEEHKRFHFDSDSTPRDLECDLRRERAQALAFIRQHGPWSEESLSGFTHIEARDGNHYFTLQGESEAIEDKSEKKESKVHGNTKNAEKLSQDETTSNPYSNEKAGSEQNKALNGGIAVKKTAKSNKTTERWQRKKLQLFMAALHTLRWYTKQCKDMHGSTLGGGIARFILTNYEKFWKNLKKSPYVEETMADHINKVINIKDTNKEIIPPNVEELTGDKSKSCIVEQNTIRKKLQLFMAALYVLRWHMINKKNTNISAAAISEVISKKRKEFWKNSGQLPFKPKTMTTLISKALSNNYTPPNVIELAE